VNLAHSLLQIDCGHLTCLRLTMKRDRRSLDYFLKKMMPSLLVSGNLKHLSIHGGVYVSYLTDSINELIQGLCRLSLNTFKREVNKPESWESTFALERFDLKLNLSPTQRTFLSVWFPSLSFGQGRQLIYSWYWHDDVFFA